MVGESALPTNIKKLHAGKRKKNVDRLRDKLTGGDNLKSARLRMDLE